MSSDDSDVEVVNDLPQEWNEDKDEYEVQNEMNFMPIQSKHTLSDITKEGIEFETNETDETEDKEIRNNYWTRDEILAHLEINPKPDEDFDEDFDERIKSMAVIVEEGVYKRVIRQGTGALIDENSAVLYNLNAYIEGQDEPFDSTWLRGRPNLHKLSYDTVIPGLCSGLLTMRRGERSELIVRPHLAYLEMGCPPRVPENATILYIVEIIKVFEEGSLQHFETMTAEERSDANYDHIWQLCDEERKSANSYFVAKRHREAAFRYRRAIRCLEHLTYKTKEDENKAKELLIKLYVNIANSYNKLGKPFLSMSNCKKALDINGHDVKALYQYGLAKMANADYEDAKRYLKEALTLKPKNDGIITALQKLDQRMNGDRILEENLYRRMGSAFTTKK